MNDNKMKERRVFLAKVGMGLMGVTAILAGIPILGAFFSPFLKKKPRRWEAVGSINSFEIGKTVEVSLEDPSPLVWAGVVAKTGAWLRRDGESDFIAFSINCTHLGCPVRWLPHADLFMCPCHGGVYYKDGTVAGGPPPRPLFRYPVRVREKQVEVLTSEIPIA